MSALSTDWIEPARDRVRVFAQYDHAFEEKADVVVVGSGPCGAVAAFELAAAGHDVYLGHPANLHGLSLAPFEIEPGVSEAELLFPRVGGLVSSIAFGPEDLNVDEDREPLRPDGERHRAYARTAATQTGRAKR